MNIFGSRIKIEGDKPEVGLKLINQTTKAETTIPMTSVLVNTPSQLSVIVPIGLEAGEYRLDIEHQLEDGKSVWFRGIIDDTDRLVNNLGHLNAPKTPILISTSLNQADLYKVASGVWLIDNDTNADKTYYVKVSIQPNGKFVSSDTDKVSEFSVWLEDYLFAMKRK